jgi:methylated-DNA-[protein]-cysteine S-methyltransferase
MSNTTRLFLDTLQTPIGELALIADDEGCLHALGFTTGHARMEQQLLRHSESVLITRAPNPGGVTAAIEAYFAGELQVIEGLRVELAGTEFERSVWSALREIPCGETRSYGDIARRIGRPTAVRAVGLANGKNPIGIVVPCHRVIGSDGSLTGYGGGIERKRWLLLHEGAAGQQRSLEQLTLRTA